MRILSPIVLPSAGDVPSLHATITQSRAIRWQFVCYDSGWIEALLLERLSHEFQRGLLVPARLHQNVEDLAFAINGAPKINALAINPDEDFIEMPAHIRTWVRAS
jgi:hypothetical protein